MRGEGGRKGGREEGREEGSEEGREVHTRDEIPCSSIVITLAYTKETWREDGWTEKSQKNGSTDQFETCVLSLWTKPLPNTVECYL